MPQDAPGPGIAGRSVRWLPGAAFAVLGACSHAPAPAEPPLASPIATAAPQSPIVQPPPAVAKDRPVRSRKRSVSYASPPMPRAAPLGILPAAPDAVPNEDPPAAARSVARPIEVDELTGFTEAQTAALFGPPVRHEEKPPARLWRYRGLHCQVTVIFYPDLNSLTYRVLNLEVAGNDGGDAACLGELASPRGPRA